MTQVKAPRAKRAPRKDIFKYSIQDIQLDTELNYSRVDMSDIENLANSIKENGVQEPLIGYKSPENPEKVIVVHGYRRFHAMQLLAKKGEDITAMFVLKNARGYTSKQKYIDIAVGNTVKELTGLEKGMLFNNLQKEGMERKEIAAKLGITVAHISDMVALASAPSAIQTAIIDGMMASTLALKIVKENSTPDEQIEVFEEAKKNMETESKSDPSNEKKTSKKITAKNVSKITKSPIKTLETVIEEGSVISESDMEVIKKVHSLLKKKVDVQEFIEAFSK